MCEEKNKVEANNPSHRGQKKVFLKERYELVLALRLNFSQLYWRSSLFCSSFSFFLFSFWILLFSIVCVFLSLMRKLSVFFSERNTNNTAIARCLSFFFFSSRSGRRRFFYTWLFSSDRNRCIFFSLIGVESNVSLNDSLRTKPTIHLILQGSVKIDVLIRCVVLKSKARLIYGRERNTQ